MRDEPERDTVIPTRLPARFAASRKEAPAATADSSLREELESITHSYRRVREEHRRAGPEGHTRRHLEVRLKELAARFEHLLEDPALAETARHDWREYLYHGAPEPHEPRAPAATPGHSRRPRWPLRWRSQGRAPLWRR
ncbi:MAG: hypothetical protein ACXVRS_12480 [Gaiellaceae bacterium]